LSIVSVNRKMARRRFQLTIRSILTRSSIAGMRGRFRNLLGKGPSISTASSTSGSRNSRRQPRLHKKVPKRSIQDWIETRGGSHQQKTMAERQNYWETRVKPDKKLAPTVDEQSNEFDSTETPLPVEPEATPSYQRTKRP